MRIVMNILIVAVLAGLVALFLFQQRQGELHADTEQQVRDGLARLYERTAYHGALERSQRSNLDDEALPYPLEVRPEWFGEIRPANLFAAEHPWIDVAPKGDQATHPPDPVLLRSGQAGFWYNPNNGMFRARVKPGTGDAETLALYNRLNESELAALPRDFSADRTPLAYDPPGLPGVSRASDIAASTAEPEAPGAALFEPAPLPANSWMPEELRPEPEPVAPEKPGRPSLVSSKAE